MLCARKNSLCDLSRWRCRNIVMFLLPRSGKLQQETLEDGAVAVGECFVTRALASAKHQVSFTVKEVSWAKESTSQHPNPPRLGSGSVMWKRGGFVARQWRRAFKIRSALTHDDDFNHHFVYFGDWNALFVFVRGTENPVLRSRERSSIFANTASYSI